MKVSVLIVEDNAEKLRNLLRSVREHVGDLLEEPDIARTSNEAKAALRQRTYDLLILDLALPLNAELSPAPDGGVALLREIKDRDLYRIPKDVIGLTAFAALREDASSIFAEDLWSIIQYDSASETWIDQISRKIRHISATKLSTAPVSHQSFLCVITALYETELEAVLRLPWKWRDLRINADTTNYYEGEFTSKGETRRVIAAAASRMGMPASGVLATKMLLHFRPQYICMTGIAAGMKDRCNLGDVIAADPAWDWGSGKYIQKDAESQFQAAPHQLGLHSSVRTKLEHLSRKPEVFNQIRSSWPGTKPDSTLSLRLGPSASGASVLADASRLPLIESQNRKLLSIEMEAYAVYAAAWEGLAPQAFALSLKSVSDFADAAKSDDYQHYAAYTSAATLRCFAEQYL